MDMRIQWNFVEEAQGTYPFWEVVIDGRRVGILVHRPECYKLTIYTKGHDYWSQDYETLPGAKDAFLHEYVTLRLEGKV